jgi:hypothetical protein
MCELHQLPLWLPYTRTLCAPQVRAVLEIVPMDVAKLVGSLHAATRRTRLALVVLQDGLLLGLQWGLECWRVKCRAGASRDQRRQHLAATKIQRQARVAVWRLREHRRQCGRAIQAWWRFIMDRMERRRMFAARAAARALVHRAAAKIQALVRGVQYRAWFLPNFGKKDVRYPIPLPPLSLGYVQVIGRGGEVGVRRWWWWEEERSRRLWEGSGCGDGVAHGMRHISFSFGH